MVLRKRGVTFLTCFRKRGYQERNGEFPQKMGDSNPGGNYVSTSCSLKLLVLPFQCCCISLSFFSNIKCAFPMKIKYILKDICICIFLYLLYYLSSTKMKMVALRRSEIAMGNIL